MMKKPKVGGKFPVTMVLEPGIYLWCSCGCSKKQPFCDGAHEGTGFAPVRMAIFDKKMVSLCQCKRTANPPHCDHSHFRLANEPLEEEDKPQKPKLREPKRPDQTGDDKKAWGKE